ncbi:site-specific integrase [Tardiphaga sp. vice352]|uniref:tyrosine-type recombinase/integrase n=1 Tax=Tardiphaga sp. vice352 TaxID=2592816 RepID=UPI001FEEA483|nr:site-specific integrase [Tardiphaga sp. vice352]
MIGTADDFSDADGYAILDYAQAQILARSRMVKRAHEKSGVTGPITVNVVMSAYLKNLEARGKSVLDAKHRSDALILPELGTIEAAELTKEQIERWHVGLSKMPARVRSKKGTEQRHKIDGHDDDRVRRRKSTANRTLTVLKAALNQHWIDGKLPSDKAWRRVKPFSNVDAARIGHLTVPEAQRVIEACAPDFRQLVIGGLQTGARYSELTRMLVSDFNADVGTVAILQSKSATHRHVVLTDEGTAFFKSLTAGRFGRERMFLKRDGSLWRPSHQLRPMAAACKAAEITPAVGFHALRHTWASLAVMAGVPLLVVARNLGHRDTRMVERHYGHMASSYITDAIRLGAPKFARAEKLSRVI